METYTPKFFDGREEINRHRVRLPHWEQKEVLQFVTWNLGDALPVAAIKRLKFQRERWMKMHPKPWDADTESEYEKRFSDRWDRWLDCGRGSCLLKKRKASLLVANTLLHFHIARYHLDSFVVMPNHVHVLFSPLGEMPLEKIIHSWKSYSSHEMSQSGMWQGRLWMKDYWDRMIRNMDHYRHVRNYIRNNPLKANLKEGEYLLWMGEEG
ncbi:transposase [Kiritimatiellaeota bacterium B1221]|nr:transposase [Kiritimatiellaeota bacterium B1221]